MKFVYLGYDFMLDLVHRLVRDGHEPAGFFTFPCNNKDVFNNDLYRLAQQNILPISEKPIDSFQINKHIDNGVDLFISAGYMHKIPDIDENRAYAINVHPAYLPVGRGIMPVPDIIMNRPDGAGLTVHKVTSVIDGGDILGQVKFDISDTETVETYSARALLSAPELVSKICSDIEKHWAEAVPQDKSKVEHFSMPTNQDRLIDWTKPLEDIDRKLRAFGRYGGLIVIDTSVYSVHDYSIIRSAHSHQNGACLIYQADLKVIAVKGGYLVVTESRFLETISS